MKHIDDVMNFLSSEFDTKDEVVLSKSDYGIILSYIIDLESDLLHYKSDNEKYKDACATMADSIMKQDNIIYNLRNKQ